MHLKPATSSQFFTILTVLLSGLASFSGSRASAQTCTATTDDLNFGVVDLSGGASVDTSGFLRVSCTGTPGRRVRVCANFGGGTGGIAATADPRYMLHNTNQLDFNIYKNAALTNIWGSWVWGLSPKGRGFRILLNAAGNGSKNRRVRARIKAGQAGTPAGLYLSSFAGGHTLLSYAYLSTGNCNVISSLGGIQVPFTVSAIVDRACTVTATDMNFGTSGVLDSNLDTTNNISVQCTSGTPYTIGLSNGSSGGTSPSARLMTAGSDNVTYGIYRDTGRTLAWGDSIGVNTVAGVGNGASQSFVGYGRVPSQTSPPPGTYTDTVTVTVSY